MSGRARTIAEFRASMGRTTTPEGRAAGLAFCPQPSDVIISPFGKCGTTLLQQMVHTLRTRGDIDHADISAVVPWLETSTDLGIDLSAPQRGEPRAFKSHLSWTHVPKGARYIVSFREAKDAAVSAYRFMEGWYFEPGAFALDDFARTDYLQRADGRDYWSHFNSWWQQSDNPDVLLLAYENVVAQPEATIRRVAEFIGIKLDEQLSALTLEHCSLPFMLQHKHLFDDQLMRTRSEQVVGLPAGADSAKVRKGQVGEHKHELSADVGALFDKTWQDRVTSASGLASYAEVVTALRLS